MASGSTIAGINPVPMASHKPFQNCNRNESCERKQPCFTFFILHENANTRDGRDKNLTLKARGYHNLEPDLSWVILGSSIKPHPNIHFPNSKFILCVRSGWAAGELLISMIQPKEVPDFLNILAIVTLKADGLKWYSFGSRNVVRPVRNYKGIYWVMLSSHRISKDQMPNVMPYL